MDMLKDLAAAEKRYGGNGWSEVEKLVLYRLSNCESNISTIKEKLDDIAAKRDEDTAYSRQQRTEQFEAIQKSMRTISQNLNEYRMDRIQYEGTVNMGIAELKMADKGMFDRLSRIEKIIYLVASTTGLFIVSQILNHIF